MKRGEWVSIGEKDEEVTFFLTDDLVIIRDPMLPFTWSDGSLILTLAQWNQIKKAIEIGLL